MLTAISITFANRLLTFLSNSAIVLKLSSNMCSASAHLVKEQHTVIAVCQMTASNIKEDNFKISKDLITSAASLGAKMVFLPEAFDYIGETKEETFRLAEALNGPLIQNMKELAKSKKVWLSLGGAHIKTDGSERLSNCHLVISDSGQVVATYNKVHLFDADIPEKKIKLKESDIIEKGKELLPPVDTPVGKIGLAICYDLRFPEMSLRHRAQGAQLLTYPSAFTFATGALHWEVLLRSRAIENQCYVIAAAQTGVHNNKRTSWGHAMVVDPTGTIIAQCSEGTGLALANINLSMVQNVRRTMPVWSHRRYDLYPSPLSQPPAASSVTASAQYYQFGQVQVLASQVFYISQHSFAFTNKCCVVPGHVLVASLRPVQRLQELTPEEIADVFQTVQKVEAVVEGVYDSNSSTVSVQDGPLAGQTIQHVHVHILPRKPGDFTENDDIYRELQKHDKPESSKKWRSEEEMAKEAEILRSYFTRTKTT